MIQTLYAAPMIIASLIDLFVFKITGEDLQIPRRFRSNAIAFLICFAVTYGQHSWNIFT
jgi:uncharacterized membrane protein AbrB (regulator of aidB expression)